MKLALTFLAILGFAASIDASANDGVIYEGLQVAEKNKTPDGLLGSTSWEKKVGGLVCSKIQAVTPTAKPDYKCAIKESEREDAAIYTALAGKEKDITPKGSLGATQMEKKIGRLSCIMENVVYPGAEPTYKCKLGKTRKDFQAADQAPAGSSAQ